MDPKKRFINRCNTKGRAPKVVGMPRNQFGTRLSQRIECEKCEKIDYVAIRLNAAKSKFCRDCAEKLLDTYDQGRQILEKKVARKCERCCRDFLISETLTQKKEELLCTDCYRGFEVWRGKPNQKRVLDMNVRSVVVKTGLITRFRKNTNDTIQHD